MVHEAGRDQHSLLAEFRPSMLFLAKRGLLVDYPLAELYLL
jgi:hypothetical protein